MNMTAPSLADKVAYYAQVRRASYADSLRLAGFPATSKMGDESRSLRLAVEPSPKPAGDRLEERGGFEQMLHSLGTSS
jgi:hypothetical protein